MKVRDVLQILKRNKELNADCFCHNPNTGDSFEIEQIQEIEDGDGNTEYVFAAFENEKTKTKEKLLCESIENLLGGFDTPIMRRKMTDFQKEAIAIARKTLFDTKNNQ